MAIIQKKTQDNISSHIATPFNAEEVKGDNPVHSAFVPYSSCCNAKVNIETFGEIPFLRDFYFCTKCCKECVIKK